MRPRAYLSGPGDAGAFFLDGKLPGLGSGVTFAAPFAPQPCPAECRRSAAYPALPVLLTVTGGRGSPSGRISGVVKNTPSGVGLGVGVTAT